MAIFATPGFCALNYGQIQVGMVFLFRSNGLLWLNTCPLMICVYDDCFLTMNVVLLLWIPLRVPWFVGLFLNVGCHTRGSYLTVHFKNAHEVGAAIKGMPLVKAEKYLKDVIAHKNVIAFRRYNGSIGRHAQGHLVKAPGNLCRWPESACKFFLVLLNNLKANGEAKGLNVKELVINHVQVNHAPVMRRRTYRAHGRIGRR